MKLNLFILLTLFTHATFASWITTYQEITESIKADHNLHELPNQALISTSANFKELEKNYGNEDLTNIYWSSNEADVLANNENIKLLLSEENLPKYENRKAASDLKDNDFYKGYFIDFFREFDRRVNKIGPFD